MVIATSAAVAMVGAAGFAIGPRVSVAVPADATTIDCAGLVITAGFYNAHVHFTDPLRWDGAASRPAAMKGMLYSRRYSQTRRPVYPETP